MSSSQLTGSLASPTRSPGVSKNAKWSQIKAATQNSPVPKQMVNEKIKFDLVVETHFKEEMQHISHEKQIEQEKSGIAFVCLLITIWVSVACSTAIAYIK